MNENGKITQKLSRDRRDLHTLLITNVTTILNGISIQGNGTHTVTRRHFNNKIMLIQCVCAVSYESGSSSYCRLNHHKGYDQ